MHHHPKVLGFKFELTVWMYVKIMCICKAIPYFHKRNPNVLCGVIMWEGREVMMSCLNFEPGVTFAPQPQVPKPKSQV